MDGRFGVPRRVADNSAVTTNEDGPLSRAGRSGFNVEGVATRSSYHASLASSLWQIVLVSSSSLSCPCLLNYPYRSPWSNSRCKPARLSKSKLNLSRPCAKWRLPLEACVSFLHLTGRTDCVADGVCQSVSELDAITISDLFQLSHDVRVVGFDVGRFARIRL